jgi:uncharacterized protein (TIGR03000 family)
MSPTPPAPAPAGPARGAGRLFQGPDEISSTSGNGMITIWVPVDAKVYVNGYETRSTGPQRRYLSRGLKDGYSYRYEIQATVLRDGKPLEETRTVYLTSGAQEAVAFRFHPAKAEKDLAANW